MSYATPSQARPGSGNTTPSRSFRLSHGPQPALQAPIRHSEPLPPAPSPRLGLNQARAPSGDLELRVGFKNIPTAWTTWDVYRCFQKWANVSRVAMQEPRGVSKHVIVHFRPPPRNTSWVGDRVIVRGPHGEIVKLESKNETKPGRTYRSRNTGRGIPERMAVNLIKADFGVMKTCSEMLVMNTVQYTHTGPELVFDLARKAVFLLFPVQLPPPHGQTDPALPVTRTYKICLELERIQECTLLRYRDGTAGFIISLDFTPPVWRKISDVRPTHDNQSTFWDEKHTWLRQTDIDVESDHRASPISLRKDDCIVDTGRWLTYHFNFSKNTVHSELFRNICQSLEDHNIDLKDSANITLQRDFFRNPAAFWRWVDTPIQDTAKSYSFLAELERIAANPITLPFNVQYQLEVCLSKGVMHECNISDDFIHILASLEPERAVKILEQAADSKDRFYDPHLIFRLHNEVSKVPKKRPGYCTKIPAATITASTIYLATPALETSNRVVRQFRQYEDRFLRVKFLDEKYRGKIMPSDDHELDELYSRVHRALTHGIKIGNRHYEFLAFGNSQFREHGAYFFASTGSLTAGLIRQWMGNFTDIKVIAKYCSRLGQCLSTTRAIPHPVTIERIPDVERNGFCFTDGVGKMSPFLARIVANHFNIYNSEQDYPSMFQFRMAGCKGVLGVDPALKGMTVQIRPSQEKFPASFHGLEICRISQFSAASLNVQLILVMSALGVRDDIFVTKLRQMLADLSDAMTNERKALAILQKNIDFNQTTISLASMILDGFMETQEPFFMSCLRLWRSWSLKYLKEKAKIFIEKGAFVLGGTDETGTLQGALDLTRPDREILVDVVTLPEVFLQISDPESKGKYRVIEGTCMLARNPSLHPGDIRVVRAVDVPALHHMKNVVVLPQNGDRDIANMCSGGDLDGDDYLVIWDKDLLPKEWDHPPMDFSSETPTQAKGPVTVADMASFFVKHIKYDTLSRIAVAHRYWADAQMDGIKDPRCLELAHLHSKAVDFAKTGVEAVMPKRLKVNRWPHWSENKHVGSDRIYKSNKVLGQLYDEVKNEPFRAAWDMPFDSRILADCEVDEQTMLDAMDVKADYDRAVSRIMAQYGIKTEFEVWTSFLLDHHPELGNYKIGEVLGEVGGTLRQRFREICYEKAGTDAQTRDWTKMKPFIVAMYTATANEVGRAVTESKKTIVKGGRETRIQKASFETMPFMSFPWIFAKELGLIATKADRPAKAEATPRYKPVSAHTTKPKYDLFRDVSRPAPLSEIHTAQGPIREGDLLDLFGEGIKVSTEDNDPSKEQKPNSTESTDFLARAEETLSPKTEIANLTPSRDVENLKQESVERNLTKPPQSMITPILESSEYDQRLNMLDRRDDNKTDPRVDEKIAGFGLYPPPLESSLQSGKQSPIAQPSPKTDGGTACASPSTYSDEIIFNQVHTQKEIKEAANKGYDWEGQETVIEFDGNQSLLDKLTTLIGVEDDSS